MLQPELREVKYVLWTPGREWAVGLNLRVPHLDTGPRGKGAQPDPSRIPLAYRRTWGILRVKILQDYGKGRVDGTLALSC